MSHRYLACKWVLMFSKYIHDFSHINFAHILFFLPASLPRNLCPSTCDLTFSLQISKLTEIFLSSQFLRTLKKSITYNSLLLHSVVMVFIPWSICSLSSSKF
jgi:hypothetical protein